MLILIVSEWRLDEEWMNEVRWSELRLRLRLKAGSKGEQQESKAFFPSPENRTFQLGIRLKSANDPRTERMR